MKINTETHAIDFEIKNIFSELKRHGIKRKDIISSSIWNDKGYIRINFCMPHKEDKYAKFTIIANNYLNNDAYYVTNTASIYINTHITPQEYETRYADTTATDAETNNHAVTWVETLRQAFRNRMYSGRW